jgi:hypothetical protein
VSLICHESTIPPADKQPRCDDQTVTACSAKMGPGARDPIAGCGAGFAAGEVSKITEASLSSGAIRGNMKAFVMPALLLALLSGCSMGPDRPPESQLISSPNGEPLGAVPDIARCEALLATWFNGADTNRDGQLSQSELEADAERWFRRADADGDGFVTVTELTAIRQPMEPPPPPRMIRRSGPPSPFPDTSDLVVRREVDLVMAADVNLDWRVSRDEFMAATARRYATATRRGPYNRAVAVADCEKRKFR